LHRRRAPLRHIDADATAAQVRAFSEPKNALMPSQADNPDGFWEHLGFVALNDECLVPAR
jgi:hypothetical protein